jgi:hypothetical protein
MTRTTIAVALATGALALPAVALASGGDDPAPSSTAPVQQQEDQRPERPDRDCPERDRGGSGGGEDSQTLL